MKKLFSLLLALALVCSLALTSAWAEKEYDLTVAGTKVTDSNAADILGNGLFAYDAAAKTLTVKGSYKGTAGNLIVNKIDGLTIRASADAQLTGAGAAFETYGDLKLTGPGKLTVTGSNGAGIIAWTGTTVTIEDADLDVSGSWGITGMKSGEKLVFRNSNVHAVGSANAVMGFTGGITFDGCEITGPEGVVFSGTNIVDKDHRVAGEVTISKPKVTIPYELQIAGKQVTSDNAADVLGDGVFAYDAAAKRLSVKGSCICNTTSMIVNSINGLTIYVAEDTTLSSESMPVIWAYKNLTITGPGALKATVEKGSVIRADSAAAVTVEDANLTLNGRYGFLGYYGSSRLDIKNSSLQITATEEGISAFSGGVYLKDCEIAKPAGGKVSSNGLIVDAEGNAAKTVTIKPGTTYGLAIAGVSVTPANAADVLGDGVFSYDAAANKLTVNGSCASGDTIINSKAENLTVYVAKDAALTSGVDAISAGASLTITGPGRLTLAGSVRAICAHQGAKVTIKDADVEASGSYAIMGMGTSAGEALIVRNSTVHASGTTAAIRGFTGGITLDGCKLTGPDGAALNYNRVVDANGAEAKNADIEPTPKTKEYELVIADTPVTDANAADVLGDGKFSYDAAANTLTVKGDYEFDKAFLIFNEIEGLRICVEKDVTLSSSQDIIFSDKNLTVTGPGKLTLHSKESSGIYVISGATLTLDKADIDAEGQWGVGGHSSGEALVIKDSRIHAAGSEAAICDFDGGITLSGCGITAPEGGKISGDKIADAYGTAAGEVTIEPDGAKPVNPFVDVKESDSFYDAVLWAYYTKPQITNGIDATHFGPMSTVTRGQAVTFLWRAMGEPEPAAKTNPFVDVPESEYYYKAILWAVEKGITVGTDATHFTPNQTCSTAHIITFLYRTMGIGADGWYEPAGTWAKDAGLLDGLTLTVAPEVDCPRACVVLFLYRQLAK